MHVTALNLTTKVTGYQRFLFVCLPQRGAEAELATALDCLEEGIEVLRFMGFPPNATATGDIESMDLLVGQSVGLVREIKPAATIVRDLVEGARQLIEQWLTPAVVRRQA